MERERVTAVHPGRTAVRRGLRAAAACAALVFAVTGDARAAGPAPDFALPGAAARPPSFPACHPGRRRLCGRHHLSRSTAARHVVDVSAGARTRRGLGLAKVRRVLGPRGSRALRRADARLRHELARTLLVAHSSGVARAAENVAGTRITTRTRLRGVPGDEVGERLRVDQVMDHGATEQRRAFRMDVAMPPCPDPGPPANTHGEVPVTARARYEVATVERSGHTLHTVFVTLEARLTEDEKVRGLAARGGVFAGVVTGSDGFQLVVTHQERVVDLRTNRGHFGPARHDVFDVTGLWPGAAVELADRSFQHFVRQVGRDDEDRDTHLISQSYKRIVQAFADIIASRIEGALKAEEAHWQAPDACVHLDVTVPASLGTGRAVTFTPTASAVGRTVTPQQLYANSTYRGYFVQDGALAGSWTNLATLPLAAGEAWGTYTTPANPWPDARRPGIQLELLSKAGLGRVTRTFRLEEKPYFVVTAFGDRIEASTARGERLEVLRLAPGPQPLTSYAGCPETGPCVLPIVASTILRETGYVTGEPGSFMCPGGRYDYAPGEAPGSAGVGLTLEAGSGKPARFGDSLPSVVEVGDSIVSPCNLDSYATLDGPGPTKTVPYDDIMGGRPVTFAWEQSGTLTGSDREALHWSESKSVTVKRVDADGSPYP